MSDFEITDAAREAQSVSVGLFGPSGCGKTLSALRLAVGIQSVVGGSIYVIDTEARRAKDYAPKPGQRPDNIFTFAFKHVDFAPPFGSDRYLLAIDKCRAEPPDGPRTIIIDSMSHEHESEGGMLEQFEKEMERFGSRGGKDNFRAWIAPKAKRRKLVVRMEQMRDVNFILTFRAADQTKPGKDDGGKTAAIHLGFMPIGGREFVFCTKACAFLPPSADGVPVWNPEFVGEKMMRRLPGFLAPILNDGKPLSQEHGRRIAEWALSGSAPNATPSAEASASQPTQKPPQTIAERTEAAKAYLRAAKSTDGLAKRWANSKGLCDELRDPIAGVDPHIYSGLKMVYDECAGKFEKSEPHPEPEDGNESYSDKLAADFERRLLALVGDNGKRGDLELSAATGGKVQKLSDLAAALADKIEWATSIEEYLQKEEGGR